MRYSKQFPKAKLCEAFQGKHGTVMKVSAALPCRSCLRPTRWIITKYCWNVCSDECFEDFDQKEEQKLQKLLEEKYGNSG